MAGPLAAIAIPSCNQERYLGEAIEAALAQTYEPLEILVSDDASADRSFELGSEMAQGYAGPHRIRLHRNESNQGVENYNTLMAMTEAAFVVIAHSDDVSRPDRVARMVEAWRETGASLVCSNAMKIDPEGRELGPTVKQPGSKAPDLAALCSVGWHAECHGATLGWAREVFEVFGGLSREHTAVSTDSILPFRAGLLQGIHYIDEPLVRVRIHPESRAETYLHRDDTTANAESNLANTLIQARYMHLTLRKFIEDGGKLEDWKHYDGLLLRTFVQRTMQWCRARNALLAERKRIEWRDT